MALGGGGVRALGISIAGALAAGLTLVYAAVLPSGPALPAGSKATPSSLTVFSSSSLPPEVQAQEAASAPLLFDRDTDTQHAAFAESAVQASFDWVQEVRAIKVYGAAPYTLTVKADASGSFQNIAGLENLNLTLLPAGWHTFAATAPVMTSKLMFALTPASGGAASGLREIEVWTAAVPVSSKDGAGLLEKLLGPTPPAHAKLYTALNPTANPTVGVVTPNDSGGDLADNKFTFSVDREPTHFVRAYLTYELFGQASFVSPLRKINGLNSNAGGGLVLPAAAWSTQAERINPAWLKRGANTVEFSVLSSSYKEAGYTVRNVRVVAELDNGANAIEAVSANQPDASGTNPVAALYDGDLASGWRPYPAEQPIIANVPAVELDLRRPTQLDGVSLHLSSWFPGQVQLSIKQAGQWLDLPPEAQGLDAGWNTIQLPASVAPDQRVVEGARVAFLAGAGSSTEVRELLVVGSAVGGRTAPPRIIATFPDKGQFYGRRGFVQGFVEPWNNGSGLASIKVGGVTVFHNAGSISEWVTKEQVGLGAQADSDAWSAEIKVVYPNGETVSSIVQFEQQMSAATAATGTLAGTLNSTIGPKTKKTLNHDESKLVVEAGTVASDTTITITPLAEESVPALDVGMVNVTKGPRRGYRFLPHGAKFQKNIAVTLPYDRALIPPGHTEDDVRTYFFDEQAGRWVALPFVGVDKTNKLLNSTTNHFTDMINAVVTVPDHPQAVSFNPTSMKDIKAADPGAQVNLIEPPRANNQGDARLSYPIEVPPGRHALQPQLAVVYSSSGGNGWMGMGWDLPMQAVTIDTRFGVPRYEAGVESETYMLTGEMLTPVAHRGELIPRSADKVFRTRVEGQFRRIVRRGDHPSNYSWEVTDKEGVKYFYGATDPATETLADEFGNRFLWALCEIRDPNGNFVKFRYAKVSDPGVGSVPGSNIYLQNITYTGHGASEGLYSVSFIRDRDPSLNEPRRADVQIDARGGFKRVTADLLRKVVVSFAGASVRSYEFRYNENPFGDNRPALAFNKTLLTSISQFGTDGALFNKHTFSYYDEARDTAGSYRGFAGSSNWDIPGDGVGIGLMGRGTASALGGNQSLSAGGHLYVGVGACCDVSSKEQTGGLKVGFSRSQSETLIAMADVDGDGLPDKVFKSGSSFFYRKNLSGPNGTPRFDDRFPLAGLTAISRERVTSTTVGGEIYFGLPVMVDFNRATTTADAYFSDVNGDGLTDLVSGGQVVFGFRNAAGRPVFGANSADTPVPIGGGAIITDGLLENAAAIEAENATNFPLLDTLRRWVAPYDGVVSIDAPVRLIEDTSEARAQSTAVDGVRVAIQLEGSELWSTTIAKDDYSTKTPTGVGAVPVTKGQRLYFRVQSVFHGEFDQVAWDPEITYTGVDAARTDVNSLPEYRYTASADFTLAGRAATVTLPATGTLRLTGTFEKTGVTTDDVKLVITRNGVEVFSQSVGFADSATVSLAQDLSVTKLDVLEWRIVVDSPIDAGKVRFTPAAHYTAAEGIDTVVDEQGNFVLTVDAPYDMDLYPTNALAVPQGFFTVPSPATTPLPVQARVRFDGLMSGEIKQAFFTVKRRGVLLLKRPVLITGSGAPSDSATILAEVNVAEGEQLFFDVSSRDPLFAGKLVLLEARVGQDGDGDGLLDTLVPSAIHTRAADGLFAQPYRGWAVAGYNGNSPRDATPINQSLLVLNENTTAENTRAYLYFPRPAQALWGGIDEFAWVKAGSASASRLGLDDIRVARSEQFAGASAPARISRSENTSISAGITASEGFSESKLDFQDLNGDRFPDIVSASGGVQYSRAAGGLEDQRRGNGAGPARRSNNFTAGASTDGAGNIARAIAAARGQVAGDGTKSGQGAQQGMDMPSLGFSANIGTGTADTAHDLIDINGDGLPDKVFRSGLVELNLGYRFTGVQEAGWNGGIVNDGRSLDAGGGVNLGFNRAFYSMAGGLSLTIGMTKSDETYADISGDGLPDKIRLGSPFSVRLNTGTGFVPVSWPGGHDQVSMDKHVSLGGGGYVTFGIAIPIAGIKIVFNPGVNLSTNLGRPEVAFRDMDGDGFADHVYSERDSELRVALNPIGRTNLLKKVLRPMGATIDLEYTRDGNTFDLPQSRWNMTRVAVFDGHVGEGADTQVTTYRYSAPKHNRLEREFFGYTSVAEEHRDTQNFGSLYRTITREYLTDSYYTKGLLKKELLQDSAGRPFTETENTYIVRDESTGQPLATLASTTATAFPQLTRTDKRFYEGQLASGKTTFTTLTYDAFGNVETFADVGEPLVATDDVLATIRYTNCQPAYIIQPNRIEVRGNGTVMRLREADIDCTTGDVREVRQVLANASAAVTNLTYFANGNLQTVTGPFNRNGQRYLLTYEYDPTVQTHVSRITDSFGYSSQATYNPLFGKVETTTDTNNNQITHIYDTVGRVSRTFGPYEQGQGTATLSFDYAAVHTPFYDSTGNVVLNSIVPNAITRHVDKDADGSTKSSGTIDTIVFSDGLKRAIQTKKDATVLEGNASAAHDRMTVSGQMTFDAFGRQVAQRYPTTEPKASETVNRAFNPNPDLEVPPSTTAYDVQDRSIRTTMPDASFTTTSHGFGVDRAGLLQFETVVRDGNVNAGLRGAVKHTYRDVRELITAVRELNNAGSEVIWTSYAYDALKQISAVVDDKNNTTTITHDNLGRQTAIENPDAGRTETQYDLASNVTKKITANLKAQAKSIDYDYQFNRLVSITYPSFPGNNVTYTYGAPGAGFNSAGRITRVTSQMGVEERQYGKLGETVYEKKTVNTITNPSHPSVFETRYHFETFGRLLRITYPDLEVVTNVYDSGGNLQSASGIKRVDSQGQNHRYNYLQSLLYDKFEQRAFMEQGNGVKTAYSYNAQTRRLSSLSAMRQGNNLFQNLQYSYDKVGNVLNLQNVVDVPPPNVFGGPTNQTFVYDDLYRLTHAEGTFQYSPQKTHTYRLDLTYDSIHNIVRKNQLHQIVQPSATAITQKKTSYDFTYAYAPSGPASVRPHAPTHIGVRTYTYDANGNQSGWTHDQNGTRRSIVWDDENRIQSLSDNGHEKTYKYDDQGQRVIKRGPQGETVYVNQFYTQRPGATGTKHIYVGKTRIASKLLRQDVPGANQNGKTPFEKDIYFYHPDYLGSSNFITDLNGKLYEHLEYFPLGESWVEENSNQQRTPYLFTAKELDEETGLYYFGARYYDPRTSVWQSTDPILADYIDGNPVGGVFDPANLALYTYVRHKPLVLNDANGEFGIVGALVGAVAGVAVQGAIDLYKGEVSSLGAYAGAAAGGALIGATAGLGAAAVTATGATGVAAGAVTTGVAVTAGAAGGVTSTVTEALVDNKAITGSDVARGAAIGAAGGALGAAAGKVVSTAVQRASPHVKGLIGEAATEVRYLGSGYVSTGKAVVQTGGRTATGQAARAKYDHAMRNVITGARRTVESKFGTAGLTPNQIAAQGRVATPGGLIVDRTTAAQVGDAARAAASSGAPAFVE
jgi:RHS repeat-associated protein